MTRLLRCSVVPVLLASMAGLTTQSGLSATPAKGVKITELTDRLHVEVNGRLFTEYFFKDVPRPFCYPLIGPGGKAMTRSWPMQNAPDEEHDHKHHRSLWFTHGSVNGYDFWSEEKNFGKIVQTRFTKMESGEKSGLIQSEDNWVTAEGTTICTDERTLRIYTPDKPGELTFDFEVTIHASNGALTFGDTKEGSMAIRLAESMRLKGKIGKGHIVNSEGVLDNDTWGKRAKWCDYYGPVDGKIVGVAIFDHPQNPRYPTWWHVRDYGLFAANPFGQHDFEKLPDKAAGNLTVPAGGSITFRYRFYLHEGNEKEGQVAKKFAEYVQRDAQ